MGVFNGAFPILPGKEDAARAFAADSIGARREEFEEIQRRHGAVRETWVMQHTPMGALMLVWIESDDPDAALGELATSDDPHFVWMRERILDVCGIDMSQPQEGPPSELVLDWSK